MQYVGVFLRGASLRRKIASALLFAAGVVGVSALALVLASLRTPEGELLVPAFVEHGLIPPVLQSPSPQTTESGATPTPTGTSRLIPALPSPALTSPTPAPGATPPGTTPPTAAPPASAPAPTQGPPPTFPGRTPPPHPTAR